MNKLSMHKYQKLPKNLNTRTELKSGWKRGSEMLHFCCTNSINTKHDLWRSGLLSNYRELFFVPPELSYRPNASNRAQNRLRTCEKSLLDCCCAAAAILSWLSQLTGMVH